MQQPRANILTIKNCKLMENHALHPPAIFTPKIEKSFESSIYGNSHKNNVDCIILDTLAVSSEKKKNDKNKFKKRAKAKFITNGFIFGLIDLNSSLKKSYWNTFHCVENLLYDHEKNIITSKYCKNRWCLVCNRIRTGKLMNLYFDEFSKFDDLYFVTLTIRNIPAESLNKAIKHMQETWSLIRYKFKRMNIDFDGIRKNECTHNLKENTYHPHIHVIIQGKKQGEILLNEWLEHYSIGYPMQMNVRPENLPFYAYKNQDLRKCDSNTLKELFKYFTKIVKRDKNTSENEYRVLVKQLDIMNQAYYKTKVFNPFGKFRNIKSEDIEEIEELNSENLESLFDGNVWEWVQDQSDWVSEYGELLTGNDYHKTLTIKTE